MCWLTKACPSTTSVIVFFKSAPSARIGRSVGSVGDGSRSIAARAPQNRRAESASARDRIIHTPRDRPLADQESVGDSGKLLQRVVVLISDGFARTIRAGHHQNFGGAGRKEQVMQRSVWQHHAEFVVFRERLPAIPLSRAQERWAAPRISAALRTSGVNSTNVARDLYILSPSAQTVFLFDIFARAAPKRLRRFCASQAR